MLETTFNPGRTSEFARSILQRCDDDLDLAFLEILEQMITPKDGSFETQYSRQFADLLACRWHDLNRSDQDHREKHTTKEQIAFLEGEIRTWNLLDLLHRVDSDASMAYRLAHIMKWVNDQWNVTITTSSEDEMDEELEEEVREIFRKNRLLKEPEYERESRPSQRRKLDMDAETERQYEKMYLNLRHGNLDQACNMAETLQESWRPALFKQYVKDIHCARAAAEFDGDEAQWELWKGLCHRVMREDRTGPFQKAVYAIFCGDVNQLLPLCKTWEDVLWVYCNSLLCSCIEQEMKNRTAHHGIPRSVRAADGSSPSVRFDEKFLEEALSKDRTAEHCGSINSLFHVVQTAVLWNHLQPSDTQCKAKNLNESWSSHLKIKSIEDPALQNHAQRFMSALIIYSRLALDQPSDIETDTMLYMYAQRNWQEPCFKPKIVAFFAARLPKNHQIDLFSQFLAEFDGDREERRILVELGAEYGLAIPEILRQTYRKMLKGYEVALKGSRRDENASKEDESESAMVDRCFQALQWLTLDSDPSADLIQTANGLVRNFLVQQRFHLAETVLHSIPQRLLNLSLLQTHRAWPIPSYLREIHDHKRLIEAWKAFDEWDRLRKEKPEDTGTLEALRRLQAWRNQYMDLVDSLACDLEKLQTYLQDNIEANDEDLKNELDTLRKLYIPLVDARLKQLRSDSESA
ncbi:107-domain-containing protein [Radiomyces spectabilis]|uniref:107-domain-containing protein n=1 Tax=Radiomyces spectabilis TaxID=64574 RepID=UPI00221FA24B|nr:107-domain-containing protein [Radiomyces spectabilis]KAI8381565.1 107-domain-containing protein [Radiomyces spectabilis]